MWGRALKSEKILAISIFIMIVTVAVWAAFRPDLIPHFNLVLLAGLIAVTTIYAYSTIQISRATKDQADKMTEQAEATRQQADASVNMAEEMAIKRYSDCQPVLIPKIDTRVGQIPEEDVLYMILASGLGGIRQRTPVGVTIRWHNAGKGVALNAMFSLRGTPLESEPNKARFFTPTPNLRTALKVDEEKEVAFDLEWKAVNMPAGYSPQLEAEYQDIYERKLTTVQEFSFDRGEEKAHLGELYFTVNGRRLGQEVRRNDS